MSTTAVVGRVDRRVGEHDLRRRARAVADDERLGTVARPGEALVVRRLPVVDDLDAVVTQARPVVAPAVLAVLGDRGHEERQAGRRRGGVLHDEQVAVRRIGERRQVGGRVEPVLVEPGDVVVDAHVAEVDRGGLGLGHEGAQLVGHGVDAVGLVGLEDVGVDRPRQERVVDAEHHVALRVARRQHRLGHHRAGVAGAQHLDGDAGVLAERGERVVERRVGLGERAVGDERDGRHAHRRRRRSAGDEPRGDDRRSTTFTRRLRGRSRSRCRRRRRPRRAARRPGCSRRGRRAAGSRRRRAASARRSRVTPRHGPCIASTENTVPAGRSSSIEPGAWTTYSWSLPHHASNEPHAASSGAPSAPSAATAWSRRSPWPATSRIRCGASVAAWATASSVSVAPLSTGWRTTSVCSDAHARPIAEIESRSPTRMLGSSPAALAWSRPPSAAMIVASRGMAATARAIERRCAGDHHHGRRRWSCVVLPPPALPGSGSRVGGGSHPLSPLVPRAPRAGRRPW